MTTTSENVVVELIIFTCSVLLFDFRQLEHKTGHNIWAFTTLIEFQSIMH